MMADYLKPSESGRLIASQAQHIRINQTAVKNVAQMISEASESDELRKSDWSSQAMHPQGDTNSQIEWCFFVDTINFSFWPASDSEGKFEVTYKNETWTGYFALCACVNRAIAQGIPLTQAQYYATVTHEQLKSILTGDNGVIIPLLDERLSILRETAAVLNQKFGGSFKNVLAQCDRSALKLVELVTEHFESYRDVAVYKDQKVSFLKRAQILAADLNSCLSARDGDCAYATNYLPDIDHLTMFADYRVPQALCHLRVLEYDPALMHMLRNTKGEFIRLAEGNVSQDVESELRGCSIHACDLIVAAIKKEHATSVVNAAAVDYFLWCYRRRHAAAVESQVPYHRMRSIYY